MEESKHFAFLLECPAEGDHMLFPDFYENMQQYIDDNFVEVDREQLLNVRWDAKLVNSQFKVFKFKIKHDE